MRPGSNGRTVVVLRRPSRYASSPAATSVLISSTSMPSRLRWSRMRSSGSCPTPACVVTPRTCSPRKVNRPLVRVWSAQAGHQRRVRPAFAAIDHEIADVESTIEALRMSVAERYDWLREHPDVDRTPGRGHALQVDQGLDLDMDLGLRRAWHAPRRPRPSVITGCVGHPQQYAHERCSRRYAGTYERVSRHDVLYTSAVCQPLELRST